MPAAPPQDKFLEFPCTGVWNEWKTPLGVGGSGLTDCTNVLYHRDGSWAKRPGATQTQLPTRGPKTPVSGFRWYRAYPSQITKLVVYTNNHLYVGNDEASLNDIGSFDLSGNDAPDFCSARDPQAGDNGADVLIITGLVLQNGSPSTAQITITGLPQTQPSGAIQVKLFYGSTEVDVPKYYVTGADNPDSIASNLCELINASSAFLNQVSSGQPPPFINEAYYTSTSLPFGAVDGTNGQPQAGSSPPTATIFLGALTGGFAGNGISFTVAVDAGIPGSLTVTPSSGNFSGGGNPWQGPVRYHYDDGTIQALSYMAPNPFAYCCSWHNHVWFWGDKNNPDTLFASDINQPEAFTFMIENGSGLAYKNGLMTGPFNGGYTIGPGDGDPYIQSCVPCGNALIVFKTSSMYMIQGYDFQSSEYQFSVTPQVVGYGLPNRHCADVLEGQIVFWSGRKFLRYAVGEYEPEHIGLPIPLSEGIAAMGNQTVIRVTAGDMLVKTLLNNTYQSGGSGAQTEVLRSVALFSVDYNGTGVADTILVYDDEKTAIVGEYAWSKWAGWEVGAWVRYGLGLNPSGNDNDKPKLNFIDTNGSNYSWAGGESAQDWGNPIAWMAQTGWITGGTPELIKNFRGAFLTGSMAPAANGTAGASFSATIIPGQLIVAAPPPQASPFGTQPQTIAFNATVAPKNGESINTLFQFVNNGQTLGQLPIQALSVMVQVNESGESLAAFELGSFGLAIEPVESLAAYP